MDVKILNFGTLNENDRPFLLNDNELSVSENIMLDSAGNLVTRYGYDLKLTLPPNAIEVVLYKSKKEIVVFSNPSNMHLRIDVFNATTYALKRYYAYDHPDTGSQRHIPAFEDVGQITEVNFTEFQNNLYFIYLISDNPAPILKYDGYIIRSVGLPTSKAVKMTGASIDNFFTRTAYRSVDFNGNVTYGPYFQEKGTPTSTFDYSPIDSDSISSNITGYKNYLEIATLTQTLNAANRTLTGADHNYKANDFVFFSESNSAWDTANLVKATGSVVIKNPKNRDFLILEIESVTGTTITFKTASFQNGEELTVATCVISQVGVVLATSGNRDFGYECAETRSSAFTTQGTSGTFIPISQKTNGTIVTTGSNGLLLENFYDSTTFKYRAPICKYIQAYGDQLVFGGVTSFYVNDDQGSDSAILTGNNDLIMYSDISDGDSGETTSRINRQLIGESFDGSVTGLARVRDSLIITKENGLYAIDGQLYNGGYSLRKIESNGTGCKSIKSFLQIESGVIFQGNDGLYLINGYVAKSITGKLDPFFSSDIDTSKTRSSVRYKTNHYLFYTKKTDWHYFVVFDYLHKTWHKWKTLDASIGLFSDSNSNVFFANSGGLFGLGATTDNGSQIISKFRTKFFDLGFQHLIKKFTKVRILDMLGGGSLNVSIYKDWSNTEINSINSVTVDAKTKHKYIPLTNGYSCAVEFENTTSDMAVSGLIIEIAEWQVSDRND